MVYINVGGILIRCDRWEHDSVNAGDTVIVEGYDGDTEVEVTDVFERKEDELALPLHRCKSILRKG